MACLFGHKWDGCVCGKCGKKRDENHSFQSVEGKCVEICGKCGTQRTVAHQFEPAPASCQERCRVCGEARPLPHQVQDGQCVVCQKGINELTAEYDAAIVAVSSDGSSYTTLCAIRDISRRYAGFADHTKLHPLCELWAETMIDAFTGFWNLKAQMKKGNVSVPESLEQNLAKLYLELRAIPYAQQLLAEQGDSLGFEKLTDILYRHLHLPPYDLSNEIAGGNYLLYKANLAELAKKNAPTYRKNPIGFFADLSDDSLLAGIAAGNRQIVQELLCGHAVSWVDAAMNKATV